MTTKKYKIGDTVTAYLRRTSGKKIKVKGKIVGVEESYGRKTYSITGGIVEDFTTRTIS